MENDPPMSAKPKEILQATPAKRYVASVPGVRSPARVFSNKYLKTLSSFSPAVFAQPSLS